MRDVLPEIDRWQAAGESVALATVVESWGSAPRLPGAKMAVTASGAIAGSVSGGCVEGAVVEAAREALRTGVPRLLHFGVADETAWAVGLACGGSIDVFVAPLEAGVYAAQHEALLADRALAIATVIAGPLELLGRTLMLGADGSRAGSLGGVFDTAVSDTVRLALAEGRPRRETLSPVEIFVEVLLPAPTLVMVGGVHIAVALTALGRSLGYRTIVVDPRPGFGNEARFPHADRLISEWPDDALSALGLNTSTAVAMLTHDPKLDDPALRVALPSPAFYVGALGSKKTQARRRQRLIEAGVSPEHVDRLHAPIGLDLGGRSPEEIALAVMAEIVAARNGRLGKN
jgi:xanthine dehydrogenase accessory factor